MSGEKVTVNANGKKAAGVRGKVKGVRDPFASREVDIETLREVTDLVIELHWDALKELEHR